MNVDFLVKMRDGAQMIADACNEQLEQMDPTKTTANYNPESIGWTRAEGSRGPYERYPAPQQPPDHGNMDYSSLLEDLKQHDGKLTRAGLFYWLFNDNVTIGRKPRK